MDSEAITLYNITVYRLVASVEKHSDINEQIMQINATTKSLKLSGFVNLRILNDIPLIFSVYREWYL
jgi:hypothetical protein